MKIALLLTLENSVTMAYLIIGFISLIAYLPQISVLFKSKGASEDVSLKTWGVWSLDAFISLMYAIVVLQDAVTCFIFSVDLLGALSILALTMRNRVHYGDYTLRSARIAAFCERVSNFSVKKS